MYTVYMHITPSNKRYIGITSKENLKERYGCNGGNYRGQIFGRAVKKYGWNNIQHIVIAQNLTKEDAKSLEIELIAKYNTINPKYGYNKSIGGDMPVILGRHHTDAAKQKIGKSNSLKRRSKETRDKISKSVKELWKDKKYREKQENKVVTDIARKHMSESHKGKYHTSEQKEKIRLSNIGKHNFDEASRSKIADTVRKQHQKEKSLGIKRNYNNDGIKTRGTKWYNNGIKNIRSKNGCPKGYVPGRLSFKRK